jgi:hypothetical protein
MAPIGVVTTTFTIDRAECQGSEPVTGTVSLRFRPTTSISGANGPDLFGPLKLCVVLQGHIKVNVAENRTSHANVFINEARALFVKREELFNGSFRVSAGQSKQFPFQIQFPTTTDFDVLPLPPTFSTRFHAASPRQLGRHHAAASIEYHLRVEAEMSGINVTITNEAPPKKILYQAPGQTLDNPKVDFSQTLQLQSYCLLPEQDRPGLLEKTRAKLNSAPKPAYAFSVTCVDLPEIIAVGETIQFNLRIKSESKGTTANSIPDVSLGDCKIEIVARTQLYATNERGADSARIDGSDVGATLALTKQDPAGVFKKEHDFTKKVFFEPVPKDIPCTFLIKKLGRSYRLRLDLKFLVSGEQVGLKKMLNLRILPPPQQSNEVPEAGPSRVNRGGSESTTSDDLPNYDEIGRSAPAFQHLQ